MIEDGSTTSDEELEVGSPVYLSLGFGGSVVGDGWWANSRSHISGKLKTGGEGTELFFVSYGFYWGTGDSGQGVASGSNVSVFGLMCNPGFCSAGISSRKLCLSEFIS